MTPIRYPESGHVHPFPTGEDILDPVSPPWRIWIPKAPLLVLGYSQEAHLELNVKAVEAAQIPVYKRKSGGGAVFLSKGSVCVALRFERRHGLTIADYFSAANGFIQKAFLEEFQLELNARGISDLAWNERKVVGSTLHLPRGHTLYLASILVSIPLELLDEFLCHPSREPDYRQGRPHSEFVQNLSEIPGLEFITSERVRQILTARLSAFKSPDVWLADRGTQPDALQ